MIRYFPALFALLLFDIPAKALTIDTFVWNDTGYSGTWSQPHGAFGEVKGYENVLIFHVTAAHASLCFFAPDHDAWSAGFIHSPMAFQRTVTSSGEFASATWIDHFTSTVTYSIADGWVGSFEFWRTDTEGNRMAMPANVPEGGGIACLFLGIAGCLMARRVSSGSPERP